MIRVGFAIPFTGVNWIGGLNYFKNLFGAIAAFPAAEIEPVILTGRGADLSLANGFPKVEIVQSSLLDRGRLPRAARITWRNVSRHDWLLERLLRRNAIALLSHSHYLGMRSAIPAVGWIPDFQHKRMPEFFDAKDTAWRNREFDEICTLCSHVVVSSHDAQRDLAQFYPHAADRSSVLQFVADVAYSPTDSSSAELEQKYAFSGSFFYVPNQFWAHKNHRVIIDALEILKGAGRPATVVATGNTRDYRNPEYFDSLMACAAERGVAANFRVLGIVPQRDLVALMRHCVALINPSRFEGWSTTVEEAKSLGKRVILSNIPVHQEQAPPGGVYFDPADARALAAIMQEFLASRDAAEEARLERQACAALPERKREFALNFERIVKRVLSENARAAASHALVRNPG
jgi:glycosyltransferase involved in cell wall biosynthesis